MIDIQIEIFKQSDSLKSNSDNSESFNSSTNTFSSPSLTSAKQRRSDKSNFFSFNNTASTIIDDDTFNQTISSTPSGVFSNTSSIPSLESLKSVEYSFSSIPPPQKSKIPVSDIASQLLIKNIFMNINNININQTDNNYYEKNIEQIKNSKLNLIQLTRKEYLNNLKEFKCNTIHNFKQSKIIQIKFGKQNLIQDNKLYQNIQEVNNFIPQIQSSDILSIKQHSLVNQSLFLQNFRETQSIKLIINQNLTKVNNQQINDSVIKKRENEIRNFSNYFCENSDQQDLIKFNNFLFEIQNIENWIMQRMIDIPFLQKEKDLQKTGSTYFLFTFDQHSQKYNLSSQFINNDYIDLIHSSEEEISYSYLHSSEILQNTSQINQYIEEAINFSLQKFNPYQLDNNQSFKSNSLYIESLNTQDLTTVQSDEHIILLNEKIHLINPFLIQNQQNLQQQKQNQIIPKFIVLEQSYFLKTVKKQGLSQIKQNTSSKNTIIKMYQNTIRKSISQRQFLINEEYITQSLYFQEKFYSLKTQWKRRGKNQKRKNKRQYEEDSEFSTD